MGEKKFGFCVPWTGIDGTPAPFYGDIGKKSRDVFGSYSLLGAFKCDIKSKTEGGVIFSGSTVSTKEGGKVIGSLDTRYKAREYNIGYGCKWTTDNVISGDVTFMDFCQGANVALSATKAFESEDASLNVRTDYRNELFSLSLEALFKSAMPIVKGGFAFGVSNIFAGYSTSFNSEPATFEAHNFTIGYAEENIEVTANTDLSKHGVSAYAKASDDMDLGIMAAINCGGEEGQGSVEVGVGCKYNVDPDCTVRAKINSAAIIGLNLAQKVRDGVALTISAQIEAANFQEGKHQVGFGIAIET